MSSFTVDPPARSFGVPLLPRAAVPAGLRVGAGFAAVFGTLWLVRGAAAAAGPLAATAAVLPGLAITLVLWRTRGRHRKPRATLAGHLAQRYLNLVTALQLLVSVPGALVVEALAGPDVVLPFIVLSVGLYLAAIAPAIRVPHLTVAAVTLTVVPLLTLAQVGGVDRTVATGLVAGPVFLLKGALDLYVSRRPR